MKVLFVVTSLMGAGHLTRTLILARAVAAAGGRAVVASGGRAIPHLDTGGVEIAPLPPVWSDGVDYGRLLTETGPLDDAVHAERAAMLTALFDDLAPDLVVTELWPFGRRALSREYEALAAHGARRARFFASIRDVLEPKRKAKRAEETAARLARWYDGVLVHGDPAVIGLGASWPLAEAHGGMIAYTGYVAAPPPPAPPTSRADEVLVAVGGGVIGRSLLEAAIGAAAMDEAGGARTWRLRVGGADAAAAAARLQAAARAATGGAPVIVEPAAADYRARLAGAACSVSLFGYNTATDLLAAGAPAVIFAMDEGGEREQAIRADAFARLPGFTRLTAERPDALPMALSGAVKAAIGGPAPSASSVDLNGAARTAEILREAASRPIRAPIGRPAGPR